MESEKVRENRYRRMAERQGLVLKKSRRRDHRALDYGLYALVPHELNMLGSGAESGRFNLTIDDVQARLEAPPPPRLGHGKPTRASTNNPASVAARKARR